MSAPSAPFFQSEVLVALRMRFWPVEVGGHAFGFRLIDPDGGLLMGLTEGEFQIVPMDESRACSYNLILSLRNIPFMSFGEHSFDFYLDGQMEARLPLSVIEAR